MSTLRLSFPPLRNCAGALAVALGTVGALPGALAQVTYFAKPPTPEQLRAALLAPASTATTSATTSTAPAIGQTAGSSVPIPASAAALPDGTRTRGIVWNTGASPAGSATANSTASAAGSATTSAATSAVAPLPPAGARMQAPAQMSAAAPAAALPINFDLGSSRIESSSLPYLETIASVLRADPSLQLVIEGHTDDRGSYNRNMVLSWDRALGVFRTLVENYGIDPKRLQPVGKGPLEPMPGTSPEDGANRRVQFRISG